jgi:hypothetical protein
VTADGEYTTDHDVIYDEVFSLAERGLREQGLDEDEAADCIEPIRDRWEQRVTPSRWKKTQVRNALADGASLSAAIATMQTEYNRLARQGAPFATW